jgi:hypothetical protein
MRYQAVVLAAALMASAGSLMPASQPAAAGEPVFAPVSTGSCSIKKTEYAAAASEDSSSSKSFVNLNAAGSIVFTQKRAGCVAGAFFANAGNVAAGDHVLLQVILDGSISCAPLGGGYRFANSDVDFSSHAAGFFCSASVAPGTHTIQVQYASEGGGQVQIFQRSLEVAHQ